MSSLKLFSAERKTAQIFQGRHHLKHLIPYPMEVTPIGKTPTEEEWKKFCHKNLNPKMRHACTRKIDGKINFIGEGGLDALLSFQEKFKNRFHLRMICANEDSAIAGLKLAKKKGLHIQELHYK